MGICRLLSIVAAALSVCGCAVGPDYEIPAFRMPIQFSTFRVAAPTVASKDAAPAADLAQWWRVFRDPELNSLVERAVRANPDIEIALTRVQEAREREIVVLGAALPTVGIASSVAGGSGPNSVKGPRAAVAECRH